MKPLDAEVSSTVQFEGRTAEEAVARARAALGDAGALRCWKTRRGGVGGFFAKEVFVAGLTPPPGSEGRRGRPRVEPDKVSGGSGPDAVTRATPYDGTTRAVGPGDHLSGLVEATSDQVSLGPLAIPAEAFDEVLAEAQAALTGRERESESSGVTVPGALEGPLPPPFLTEEEALPEPDLAGPENGAAAPADPGEHAKASASSGSKARPTSAPPAKKAPRPKPKAGRKPPAPRSGTAAKAQRSRSERIPDLRPGLRGLGVPASYLPRGQRPSLDQLVTAMGTLPSSPPLPSRTGSVVAVVGSEPDLCRTVDLLTAELSLDQRDVLRFGGTHGAVRPADLTAADGTRLGRQIARRRGSRTSLLVLASDPGAPFGHEQRELLERVRPDYVLAAVGAHSKRVDVEHRTCELPVDALAVWDLSGTRTPAELLGILPIAFVDGEPASSLAWALLLASRAIGQGGR